MYVIAGRPVVDIMCRLVLAAVGALYVVGQLLLDATTWTTTVLSVATVYNAVTGVRRLLRLRRGEPVVFDLDAWLAEPPLPHVTEPEVVAEWHSDDDWVSVYGLRGGGRATHEVAFDDWIAHMRSEEVDAYVADLRRRHGAREAWRVDREVLQVVAPGVSTGELGRDAHMWLRVRVTGPEEPRD